MISCGVVTTVATAAILPCTGRGCAFVIVFVLVVLVTAVVGDVERMSPLRAVAFTVPIVAPGAPVVVGVGVTAIADVVADLTVAVAAVVVAGVVTVAVPPAADTRKPFGMLPYSRDRTPFRSLAAYSGWSPASSSVTRPPAARWSSARAS
jgi:hypothetical protein